MAASSNSEHRARLASASDPSSTLFFTAQSESIEENIEHSKAHWSQATEFTLLLASATDSSFELFAQCESIEEQIEQSKSHWSRVTELDSDDEGVATESRNVEVFKALQLHPIWGSFFKSFGGGKDDGGELVVGEKFAEGGQAELYQVQVNWRRQIYRDFAQKHGIDYALKVFKRGTSLKHLKSQWPKGFLKFHAEKLKFGKSRVDQYGPRYFCDVICGTLLEDGRFAFLMVREKGDLRQTIDNIMKQKSDLDCGPFSDGVAKRIIYAIAQGMAALHERNIIHRDLKASNVLITKNLNFIVADFETSIGVVGTGFFRAPEILQACKDDNVSQRRDVFTKEADVYAFGMTSYEILTGKLPFEGYMQSNFDNVLKGQRPEIPKYVDEWAWKLLHMCWQPSPSKRPSFDNILEVLKPSEGEVTMDWPQESEVILFPKEEVKGTKWDVFSLWRRRLKFSIIPCPGLTLPFRVEEDVHHIMSHPPP